MRLGDLPRLARTLRTLRASQIVWRGRYAIERRLPAPHIRLPVAYESQELKHLSHPDTFPDVPLSERYPLSPWDVVAMRAAGMFEHLHRRMSLGRPPVDWRLGPQSSHRLWTITLHYHAWLYELAEAVAARLPRSEELFFADTLDWITRCDLSQPGARDLAWNSYAIATRIGWWIRAYRRLGSEWWNARREFQGRFLGSLWRQADFLYRHPEWDLRGNHILRNAVGLAWAGRFFAGERPRLWMSAAESIARSQIDEQILSDGGHFERSPYYHLQVMHDLDALACLVERPSLVRELHAAHRLMGDYLDWMRHPDGTLALFNDGACESNVAASLRDTEPVTRNYDSLPASLTTDKCRSRSDLPTIRNAAGARHFSQSGFCVWHGDPWSVFFDVGEVGPDCQPGHAHADTLSMECSYRGQRLFVDPGTHSYDNDAVRRSNRSTAAHNTVCIDGRDSSEVWHVFRVGARARPVDVRVDYSPLHLRADAAHTGFETLPGAPRHARRIEVREGGELRIADRIAGGERYTVSGGWLLAPGWSAAQGSNGWVLSRDGQRVEVRLSASAPIKLAIEPADHHPEYGLTVRTSRLVWRYEGKLPLEVDTTCRR